MKRKKKSVNRTWWRNFLRIMVRERQLTPGERLASRVGYFGAGCLLAAHWTLEPTLYIAGFCCVLVQVASRKQWNLVVLNINGLIAWTKHLINNL